MRDKLEMKQRIVDGVPVCDECEPVLHGPITWKLLSEINSLLVSDIDKPDFVEIGLHPKGYLCIRRGTEESIFGFEFRIPIADIHMPIEPQLGGEFCGISFSTEGDEKRIQSIQFEWSDASGTDIGFSRGLSMSVGLVMSNADSCRQVADLLNTLLEKLRNTPTQPFAELPSYWAD